LLFGACGVAFSAEPPDELPVYDLGERLRKSEIKKRQLQHRSQLTRVKATRILMRG
jgi:hypothetical protein